MQSALDSIILGLESIAFYTPHYYLNLRTLAEKRGVDVNKYYEGIGQEKMAVPPPDEDVVTMAANAGRRALAGIDPQTIDTLLFATESGIDQSKAAAIYVHKLLDLPTTCKAIELKQACCSSTAGLQMGMALVTRRPEKRALLIASDIARYGFGSAGEPTQGAGAMAMVISAYPTIVAFEDESGSYTEDVMDFWRPNYMDEALVDGKYSIKIYLKALTESWRQYVEESGRGFADIDRFCYHLPFTRMAEKAHLHLAKINGSAIGRDEFNRQLGTSLRYNRLTGNCYTASLYEGLLSLLLETQEDLTQQRVGLFSYGSGCMAVFFSGIVCRGYQKHLDTTYHHDLFATREEVDYKVYEDFYSHMLPVDGRDYRTGRHQTGLYRLAGIVDHKRIYEACDNPITARKSPAEESPCGSR